MNIWMWGTGRAAKEAYLNGLKEINGFIETYKTKETFFGLPVIDTQNIPEDFQFIVVANRFADEIYESCVAACLDMQKIIFLIRGKCTCYVKPTDDLRAALGERNFTNYQYSIIKRSMELQRILFWKRMQSFTKSLTIEKPLKFRKNICGQCWGISLRKME